MPVKLEILTAPTAADWLDLEKIHQETFNGGLTYSPTDLNGWLSADHWIFAGRFNDRIIGVVLAEKSGHQVHLRDAAVRTITQRRGVMHQMLHFMQRWATEMQSDLVITNCPSALIPSLSKRHFQTLTDQMIFHVPR